MSSRFGLRAIALAVHKYTGLAAGLVIVVVSLTGAILVFAGPINRALHPELWRVEGGAVSVSADSALALARLANPDLRAVSVQLARGPTEPHVVRLQGGLLAYVDPSTGRLLGEHEERGSFIGVVEGLHTALLMGRLGLWIVVLSTIVFLGLLLTGLVLWWPRTKKESKRNFWVKWTAGWKRLNYDGHNVFGFYSSGYLILIALTGLLLSFPVFKRTVYALTGAERPPGPPMSEVVSDASPPISLGEAILAAEADGVGHVAVGVSVPARPRQAIRVGLERAEGGDSGARTVWVDQFSGSVLRVDRPADRSPVARALDLAFPIHAGTVFGLPSQILAFIVCVVAGVLPITGFIIWLPRWRAKRRRRARDASGSAGSAAGAGGDGPAGEVA